MKRLEIISVFESNALFNALFLIFGFIQRTLFLQFKIFIKLPR